ncbi:hypothetical protein Ocin01_06686 [Orchesella cincta]|uniref:Uncharacterized protein n=1 Tax=Orchesella cincta TaxID=48709 RepID=A0A1D2N410_ORCCI|nr:hypothetical protein Ocin01_06686 [Orchesella cincta]
MSFSQYPIFITVILCQIVAFAVGFGQPNVISFGDFMEFDIGIHRACENATAAENTTLAIISSFRDCTYKLSEIEPNDMFENFDSICKNRGKYFQCWDTMKANILSKCGKDKEQMLPAVYRTTVSSLCGSDNAAKRIDDLKKAATEIRPDDESRCPQETGIHWIENCQELLATMNSPDLCARHAAIDKCIAKITCNNIKYAKLLKQVYSDARPYLQCNERRV